MADDAAELSSRPTIVVEPPSEVPLSLELPKTETLPVPPAPPPSTPILEEPPEPVSDAVERLHKETMMVTTEDGEPAQATVIEPVEEASAPVDAVLQPAEAAPEPSQEESPPDPIPEVVSPDPEPATEEPAAESAIEAPKEDSKIEPAVAAEEPKNDAGAELVPPPEKLEEESMQAPTAEVVPDPEVPKSEAPQVPEVPIEQTKLAVPEVAKDLPVAQIASLLGDLKKRGRKRDKARQNVPGPVFTALLGHQIAPIVKELLQGISKKPELSEAKL